MPIVGLTDNVAPRFPRLGKLRKGGAKPEQGNQPGPDLDYFRFDGEPDVTAAFAAAYGNQPRVLSVYLPFAAVEDCFAAWKEKWSAGGLVHRCDGQTMQIWRTPAGTYSRDPKACDGGCDEVARLEVILPELFRAGHVGYVTLETHGLNDILGIQATLNAAYTARRDLRGIEFVLRRVEREISTPGQNGQRVRRAKWIVELAPAPRWAQVQLAMAQSIALALPEPSETVDAETGELIDAPAQLPAPAISTTANVPTPVKPATTALTPTRPAAAANGAGRQSAKPVPKKFTLQEVERVWTARWQTALGLKLQPEAIQGGIPVEEFMERCKALKALIIGRAKQIVSNHPQGEINLADSDEQIIEQALRLAPTWEAANVPA